MVVLRLIMSHNFHRIIRINHNQMKTNEIIEHKAVVQLDRFVVVWQNMNSSFFSLSQSVHEIDYLFPNFIVVAALGGGSRKIVHTSLFTRIWIWFVGSFCLLGFFAEPSRTEENFIFACVRNKLFTQKSVV